MHCYGRKIHILVPSHPGGCKTHTHKHHLQHADVVSALHSTVNIRQLDEDLRTKVRLLLTALQRRSKERGRRQRLELLPRRPRSRTHCTCLPIPSPRQHHEPQRKRPPSRPCLQSKCSKGNTNKQRTNEPTTANKGRVNDQEGMRHVKKGVRNSGAASRTWSSASSRWGCHMRERLTDKRL